MANFNKNDWVRITPTPDLRWVDWIPSIQTEFCNRLGFIEDIMEDSNFPEDRDEDLLRISVFFGDWTFQDGPKFYYAFFKKRHVILSSRSDGIQYINDENASKETHEYERCIKEKRDEIFKHIFGVKEAPNIEEPRTKSWNDTDEESALSWMVSPP